MGTNGNLEGKNGNFGEILQIWEEKKDFWEKSWEFQGKLTNFGKETGIWGKIWDFGWKNGNFCGEKKSGIFWGENREFSGVLEGGKAKKAGIAPPGKKPRNGPEKFPKKS